MLKRNFLFPSIFIIFGLTLDPTQSIAQEHQVVLHIHTTGGLCRYGECYGELLIYDDGTGFHSDGVKKKKPFSINSQELSELLTLIKETNFEDIRKTEFTGTCPTAYDGIQVTYSFFTSHGEEVLDSCKHVFDEQSPLIKVLQRIQAKAYNSDNK